MARILYATKDNAEGRLNAGISAGATSIVLQSGEGAEFPQPYTGDCSSTGSSTVLNDTGALASLAVGDFIRNVTDGSWAYVTVAGTNSITTTRLRGGTLNIWTSGDIWQVNEFIITIEVRDADGDVTAREKVLIKDRSTDTLTVRTRGYDGSTAQSFSTNDYVNLHVVSNTIEHFIDCIYDALVAINTNQTDIDNIESGASFYALATGSSNAYAITISPAPTAYATGNIFIFKANFANTGTCTLNVNSLGAKTIKKADGATNLDSGDIANGQIVQVVYDGTNLQMGTQIGNAVITSSTITKSIGFYGDGTTGAITWSSNTNLDPTTAFNYTTSTLDVSTTLSVSSVNTPLVIKSSGNVTINGTVSLSGKGGAAGAGGSSGGANAAGQDGTSGTAGASIHSSFTSGGGSGGGGGARVVDSNGGGGGGAGSGGNTITNGSAGTAGSASGAASGGSAGSSGTAIAANQLAFITNYLRGAVCGGGGGGGGQGGSGNSGGAGAVGGAGGAGGGCLIWLIGGNLTLGASSTITVSGAAGTSGTSSGGIRRAGGGGGSGGTGGTAIIIVLGSITNSGTTLTVTGGAAGSGGGGGTNAGAGGNGAAGASGNILIHSLTTGTTVLA